MLKDFRQFLLRGNVVDLAVGVIIGAAFTTIVNSLVADILTPLIAAVGGQPDFSAMSFTINSSQIMYGKFLNALISFLIVASVVFFAIVQPINHLVERANKSKQPAQPGTKNCPECLSAVPSKATRCAHCAIKLT